VDGTIATVAGMAIRAQAAMVGGNKSSIDFLALVMDSAGTCS